MGQIVYIKTDVDQMPAQITRIIVYPNNFYMYGVTHKGAYYTYDEIELSADRDVVFATGGNIAAPPKPQ
jgi:hypothetical protein